MSKKIPARTEPVAFQVVFRDVIPVAQAVPGDLVLFNNRVGRFCGTRIGVVVQQRKAPPADCLAVRLKKPDGRLEKPQIIHHKDVLNAYREVSMEDPKEEEL